MISRRRDSVSSQHRAGGYSLLETLVYVAVLGIVLNIFASIFASNTRLSAVNTLALNRLRGIDEVQRVFRDAVREASGVAVGIGDYRSGEEQLVLRVPQEEGTRYIVLGALREDGRLCRLDVIERDGKLEAGYMATYPQVLSELRFVYDADKSGAAPLIAMEAVIRKEAGERAGRHVVHRFMGSPRAVD